MVTGKDNEKPKDPIIDWEPTPGFVLCKEVKREELAELYNKASTGPRLSQPDNMGRVSDGVAVGEIVIAGKTPTELSAGEPYNAWEGPELKPGDYVAYMPFVDLIMEIDGLKYRVVGYDKIRAVRKG